MRSHYNQIVFPKTACAELREAPASGLLETLDPQTGILIENECSIVSAGTELACRRGLEWWAQFPFVPGYGSVGRVVKIGTEAATRGIPGAAAICEGQRVLTFGRHAEYTKGEILVAPVPKKLDPVTASFARMAAVACGSLRASDAELGDFVAVIGLGLVGNFAAQLFALSGCEVIGMDPSARRREQAAACGIPHVLAPGADLPERVAAITGGRLCDTIVEATGLSSVALETAPQLCGKMAEIILLGSPRAPHTADVTPFLSQLHLCRPIRAVKGALEWRYPVPEHSEGLYKHSVERNIRMVLRLLEQGSLKTAPLLTHVAPPADCQTIYDGLETNKDAYTGVVFDWRKK